MRSEKRAYLSSDYVVSEGSEPDAELDRRNAPMGWEPSQQQGERELPQNVADVVNCLTCPVAFFSTAASTHIPGKEACLLLCTSWFP